MTDREKMENTLLKSLLWELDENWIPVRVDIETTVKNLIENGVVMREKGEWEEADDGDGVVCSVCREDFCVLVYETERFNFCPNCGADMRKGENDG